MIPFNSVSQYRRNHASAPNLDRRVRQDTPIPNTWIPACAGMTKGGGTPASPRHGGGVHDTRFNGLANRWAPTPTTVQTGGQGGHRHLELRRFSVIWIVPRRENAR